MPLEVPNPAESSGAQNPIEVALQRQQPFVYFHTHHIDAALLDEVLGAGKSLEIDISANPDGEAYIGHPPAFYDFKQLPAPDNLALDEVIETVAPSELFVVLDCKDRRTLPKVARIIGKLGAHRCLVHAWADALLFEPYPPEIQREPHWPDEDLPLDAMLHLKETTGVPLMLSCRGLTDTRLQEESETILHTILSVTDNKVAAINFNLPQAAAPAQQIMQTLLRHGILPAINIDVVPQTLRPVAYLGMTDDLVQASRS